MDKLTDKYKAFILAYINNGFNATQAAIKAGYSKNSASESGCEILMKSNVKEEILKHFERQGDITQKILAQYMRIAMSDITDFVEIDKLTGTIKIKPLKDIPKHMTTAIKKIKEKRVIKDNADGTSSTVYDNVEYELYDKQKALDKIFDIAALIPAQKLNLLIDSGSDFERKLKDMFEKHGEKKIDEFFKLLGD